MKIQDLAESGEAFIGRINLEESPQLKGNVALVVLNKANTLNSRENSTKKVTPIDLNKIKGPF